MKKNSQFIFNVQRRGTSTLFAALYYTFKSFVFSKIFNKKYILKKIFNNYMFLDLGDSGISKTLILLENANLSINILWIK